MEGYKARPGVLLTQICGEYLLVATKAARTECPFVTILNESSAFIWRMLEKGTDLEALEAAVAEEYESEDREENRKLILALLDELDRNHYVLHVEQGGDNE